MFFFIAGIQPKRVYLDDQPRVCPSCGLGRARLARIDHYLSVFFLPLFRVKKGDPFLECSNCGGISGDMGDLLSGSRRGSARICPYCGNAVDPMFRFCPFCGRRL